MTVRPALVALLALLGLGSAAMPVPPPDLRAEFWTDLDGIPRDGEEYPISDAEAARRILDEAAWVFSGMVDGFDFEWTPANTGRKIDESFTLLPLGSIQRGDPRLVPGAARHGPDRMSAWVEFQPDESDARSLESSRGAGWKSSQGMGGVDRMRGYVGRRESYIAAIKSGIENYLRSVEPSRPRVARGRVAIGAPPTLAIVGGEYRVQARLRIQFAEIRRWSIF